MIVAARTGMNQFGKLFPRKCSFNKGGVDTSFHKRAMAQDFLEKGRCGLDAVNTKLRQCPLHQVDCLGASGLMDDQFADHRIVVGRHNVATMSV